MENFNELLKERTVTYKPVGSGNLYTDPDADKARAYFRDEKPRKMTEKLTNVADAVERLVKDGDYIGVGGLEPTVFLQQYCMKLCERKERTWDWPVIQLPMIFRSLQPEDV